MAFVSRMSFCRAVRMMSTKVAEKDIKKSVFISQSFDVNRNLALEEWILKNFDFNEHHVMLLWRNDPCVVIGRNQNPWCESDPEKLAESGVSLARRNSGGGTVYHDKGNLNITFFAPQERYNRKNNLVLLAKTLEREWNLFPEINHKEDIIIDNCYKISGTASRITRNKTYHHCTLLVDANKDLLKSCLAKTKRMEVDGKRATKSDPSPTVNLSELHSNITIPNLMAAVGWQYLRTTPLTHKDAGWAHVQQQNGFQMVNPTDEWFPGLEKIKNELSSWEWRFGSTPEFVASKEYDIGYGDIRVEITVQKGIVGDVSMNLPENVSWGDLSGKISMVSSARGQRFSPTVFTLVEQAIKQQQIHFTGDYQQAARV